MNIVDPKTVGFSKTRFKRLSSSMKRYIDQGKISGLSILVSRHGKTALFETMGYASIEDQLAVQTNTIFRIYSMTKPITVVAVMTLFEEGHFFLNDPISAYIPEFADKQVVSDEFAEVPALIPAQREITIKDLLTHTAGLSHGFFSDSFVDRQFREHDVFSDKETLEVGVKKLAALPLVNHPGEAWRYGFAMDVLAYLVELVSGMPFDQFLTTRIFEPLGMVDTGHYAPPEKMARLSKYYAVESGEYVEESLEAAGDYSKRPVLIRGGSGLVSTMEDYLRFSRMLLNGGQLDKVRLLSRKTVGLISVNHLSDDLLPLYLPPYGKLFGMGFGLGVGVIMDATQSSFLASTGSYCWGGDNSTLFWVDPQEDLIAIVMPNTRCGIYPEFYWKFINLVYRALDD